MKKQYVPAIVFACFVAVFCAVTSVSQARCAQKQSTNSPELAEAGRFSLQVVALYNQASML